MFRLSDLLERFEGNNYIEIYGKHGLLFDDTKEKILENIDYQILFAHHYVKYVSLNTDWHIRPIFKIYID